MARQRMHFSVTVYTADGGEVDYGAWCTSVDVHKDGSLRLMDGWNQRAYHPADEWLGYSVQRIDNDTKAVLGTVTPEGKIKDASPAT